MVKHTHDRDETVKKKLAEFKDYCWKSAASSCTVLGLDAREAYDIFDYLEMIMDEKGIVIGSGVKRYE